jgi:hypothetical protein
VGLKAERNVTKRPDAGDVPANRRAHLADDLQRVLGTLPETNSGPDRMLRRHLRAFAEELRGIRKRRRR